jgi:hypothetical protein
MGSQEASLQNTLLVASLDTSTPPSGTLSAAKFGPEGR